MNQFIQLDPFSPPMHPMLQMFRKRVRRSMGAEFNPEELHIFNQQLCKYLGVQGYRIKDFGLPYDVLSGFISSSTTFLNTSSEILDFPLSLSSSKMAYFVCAVDFSTGKLFNSDIPQGSSLVDISSLMPYSDANGLDTKHILLRLDGSLGVDLNWVVVLEEGSGQSGVILPLPPEKIETVRLMNFVFEDYSLQKDWATRDYKYKAALIENLISSNHQLNFYLKTHKDRSKAIFSFQPSSLTARNFKAIMKEKGFDVGINIDKNGNEFILIANFINHSKEQIEAFVDTVNDTL